MGIGLMLVLSGIFEMGSFHIRHPDKEATLSLPLLTHLFIYLFKEIFLILYFCAQ
jgi:hypothetical protein